MAIRLEDLPPAIRKQAEEQIAAYKGQAFTTAPKPNKYRNVKVVINGIKFDSIAEGKRYQELMLLLRAGKIKKLKLQPEFTLQEAYKTPEGMTMPAIRYRADFSYERETGKDVYGYPHIVKVVEDVKSPATRKKDTYRIKMKEFHDRFGFPITEISSTEV